MEGAEGVEAVRDPIGYCRHAIIEDANVVKNVMDNIVKVICNPDTIAANAIESINQNLIGLPYTLKVIRRTIEQYAILVAVEQAKQYDGKTLGFREKEEAVPFSEFGKPASEL